MKKSEIEKYKELKQILNGVVIALISMETHPIRNLITTLDDTTKAMEKMICEFEEIDIYEKE